jgi:hypothetical protein
MTTVIAENDMGADCLARVLLDAAIAFTHLPDDTLHVTEFDITYHLFVDPQRRVLRFGTSAKITCADRMEVLSFTNSCNSTIAMLGFSYDEEGQSFYGHYELPYRGGILREHIVRVAREFPGHFNYVYRLMATEGLLDSDDIKDEDDSAGVEQTEAAYQNACEIVFSTRKASCSWLQRQLGVSHDQASAWIVRMEGEGLISPPSDKGLRKVLRAPLGRFLS